MYWRDKRIFKKHISYENTSSVLVALLLENTPGSSRRWPNYLGHSHRCPEWSFKLLTCPGPVLTNEAI